MKKREINIQTGEETVTDLTAEEVSAKEAKEVEHQTKLDAENAAKTTKKQTEHQENKNSKTWV